MGEEFEGVPSFTHLSIRSIENDHYAHDWRDLMRIKNEILGHEREAIEVYPAMSRITDMADQFHLWVMEEGQIMPVGFMGINITDKKQAEKYGGVSQRKFEKGFLSDSQKEVSQRDVDLEQVDNLMRTLGDRKFKVE